MTSGGVGGGDGGRMKCCSAAQFLVKRSFVFWLWGSLSAYFHASRLSGKDVCRTHVLLLFYPSGVGGKDFQKQLRICRGLLRRRRGAGRWERGRGGGQADGLAFFRLQPNSC